MDTFSVSYAIRLTGNEQIDARLEDICYEQSVEMPPDTITEEIRSRIVGRVIYCGQADLQNRKLAGDQSSQNHKTTGDGTDDHNESQADSKPKGKLQRQTGKRKFEQPVSDISDRIYHAEIAWPVANTGREITQFLNVLFGNVSMKPGVCITGLDWDALVAGTAGSSKPDTCTVLLAGPALGVDGIRRRMNIPERPLSATALKPMGLTARELGSICYEFACGGIDIIKDDHGLADQSYAPYRERVEQCTDAVKRAADTTGRASAYIPNITAGWPEMMRRYEIALELGAGGVMIAPHITGLAALDALARRPDPLPVLAHPAFSGSYVLNCGAGSFRNSEESGRGTVKEDKSSDMDRDIGFVGDRDRDRDRDRYSWIESSRSGNRHSGSRSAQEILHKGNGSGFTSAFLYGELWRALGADMVIYPNAGGRFPFSREECLQINYAARRPLSIFRSSFPVPGGGIQRDNLHRLIREYGPDTVYLLGGSLYQHPEGIRIAAREICEQMQ